MRSSALVVAGHGHGCVWAHHVGSVVPDIEVQSARDCSHCFLFDDVDNVRTDGSDDGIVRTQNR